MPSFTEITLIEPLQRGLAEVGYAEMTPVQAASLPPILAGRDVVAQARTGSGKTAAFALGLLSKVDATAVRLQGLVLCPTRELADQVSREIRRLARFIPNVKVLTLCGGVPLRPHLASLAHEPHIVVGTPGRILDLVQKDALPLQAINVLVLDEADRMLDMGFADDIHSIIEATSSQRQTLMFSATIPPSIRDISSQFQRDAVDITVPDTEDDVSIAQTFYEVETVRNGRTRDLLFDATGRLVEVEEAVPLDAVPRAVRTALEAQGAVISVESVTRGATVSYEGVVRKNGKRTEVALAADGTPHKP